MTVDSNPENTIRGGSYFIIRDLEGYFGSPN